MRRPALDRRRLLAGASGAAALGFLPRAAAGAAAEMRPFNDRLYGWPIPADSTRNARWMLGRRLAVRLRADRTGTVTGLVWLLRLRQGTEREGRYSARGGGYVHIELRAARPDGYPVRAWPDFGPSGLLARTAPNNGRELELEEQGEQSGAVWQEWPLDRPVEVRAGERYHAVFVPHEHWAWSSINCCGQDAPPPLGSGQFGGPYYGDDFTLLRETAPGSELFENLAVGGGPTLAALFLRYADGMLLGPPTFGSWRAAQQALGGRYAARQRFTVADHDRLVDGVWIRAWTEGEAPADLLVELAAAEDDASLETIAVAPGQLPTGPPVAGGVPVAMLHLPFRRPLWLSRGGVYDLRLRSPRRGYGTTAVRQIGALDRVDLASIRDRIGPDLARAEISVNGGASWGPWSVEGLNDELRNDMTLPVAFTLVA